MKKWLTKLKEAESCKFEAFPKVTQFRSWKMSFKKEVASASGRPDEAFIWITEIEEALSVEDLQISGSGWETLDAKIAAGLAKIISGEFQRQIQMMEEEAALQKKMIKGRQIAFLIYHHFKISATEGSILEFEDLLAVELKGDNLRAFLNDWESTLLGLKKRPEVDVLESLFNKQLKKSEQLKSTMALYTQGHVLEGKERSYATLMKMLKTFLENKRREKVREEAERSWHLPFLADRCADRCSAGDPRMSNASCKDIYYYAV